MSEPHRIQAPGILFHIINRGNARQVIFRDVSDREHYLGLIFRYKTKYDVRIYHYVLMDNHIHMLLEPTREATISRFMSGVTRAYSTYFNKKYGAVGHVWQARFRSIAIETEVYYARCAMYIELNPVRAGMVRDPSEYHWSSYHASVRGSHAWLDVHPLLRGLQTKQEDGSTIYESLIRLGIQKIAERRAESFSRHAAYGTKAFIAWHSRHAYPKSGAFEAETSLRPSRESESGDRVGSWDVDRLGLGPGAAVPRLC